MRAVSRVGEGRVKRGRGKEGKRIAWRIDTGKVKRKTAVRRVHWSGVRGRERREKK